jgi:cobalamin biosynthetic protein CobC
MPDARNSLDAAAARAPLHHGGDLACVIHARAAYAGTWLDLSTGINPWPYPLGELPASLWTRLPDSALDERLGTAAAAYYGAPDAACVVSAPGSQALIQLLPRLRPRARAAVLCPTYGEHEACWAAAGHLIRTVTEVEALAQSDTDVAIVTNPNNPDGRRLMPAKLLALADRLGTRGGWLVIDEAFTDTAPELSLAGYVSQPGLVVLRSFGKFFGLAGLRLGFALAEPLLARRLRAALGPWAVSGPAAWIAASAFADRDWTGTTRRRLAIAARDLDDALADAGLAIVGGTSLYRLAASPRADAVYETLLRHGIYVRRFAEQPNWLRFGLPRSAPELQRLKRALASPTDAPLLQAEQGHE